MLDKVPLQLSPPVKDKDPTQKMSCLPSSGFRDDPHAS